MTPNASVVGRAAELEVLERALESVDGGGYATTPLWATRP
jgi:hypothetical protein